ncbi:MAG: adenylate/guanylate cyclase domain-containing protein [Holosporales bacterium]
MAQAQEKRRALLFPWKQAKIRFAILSVFLGLFSSAIITTSLYTYLSISDVMLSTSRQILDKTQDLIITATERYLNPAIYVPRVEKWHAEDGHDTPILEDEELKNASIRGMQELKNLHAMFHGDEEGNLYAVGLIKGKRLFRFSPDKPLPVGAVFYERQIQRKADGVKETYRYLNAQGHEVGREANPNPPTFDPRARPWYIDAKSKGREVFSDVYIYDSGDVGITRAVPVFNKNQQLRGVFSADITVRQISELLARQKAGQSGINFIVNENGELIGYPDPERVVKVIEGRTRIAKVNDISDQAVVQAYNLYQKNNAPFFFFTRNGISYIASFVKFPAEVDARWTLGMVVLADDFIGAIKLTLRDVLIIALVILVLASLMLIVFSHKISYPIEVIAGQMRKIQNMEIDEEEGIPSRLQEISQINEAVMAMKAGLASFSKFVPKALVRRLIHTGQESKMGGERRQLTIMFTDIAGFTSISEGMKSEEITKHLSEYLDVLSRIVLQNKGTIDKYIGDAIMAFWGAPDRDENQTFRALEAILLCQQRLKEMNAIWTAAGKPSLPTRFGLHYGEVIVGNIGSADRLNYTVIGDAVNLASRLEGTNKLYGTGALVSEPVYERGRRKYLFRPVDMVAVKGKKKGIRIYELLAKLSEEGPLTASADQRRQADFTTEAFELYLDRDFAGALKIYEELLKRYPDDSVAALFIARCHEYQKTPPPSDWDGVCHLTVK